MLPYSYRSKISLEKPAQQATLLRRIYSHLRHQELRNLLQEDQTISFSTKDSLLYFSYKVELTYLPEKKQVRFWVQLEELLKITLVLIVFSAFFSTFSINNFLIFSGIFVFVFYSINLIFIHNAITKLIKTAVESKQRKESFSAEQKKWMKDPNRCPGCGATLGIYDRDCPECGLRVRQNNYTIPLDLSKYKDKQIVYHYKETNKKKT